MKSFTFSAAIILLSINLIAQDLCIPIGWGSYNGTITGGGDAAPVIVKNASALKSALSSNSVIHIDGIIDLTSGKIELSGLQNLSIIGMPGAKIIQKDGGIRLKSGCKNIIIQNLIFEGPGGLLGSNDNLEIQGGERFWIDHCEFIDASDGNMDIKNSSNYISITYCKFRYTNISSEHKFSNLIAAGDTDGDTSVYKITYQYCWWAEGVKERMPRTRFGKTHVANCYYNSVGNNSCVAPGMDANIRVEKCHFEKVDDPIELGKIAGIAVVEAVDNIFTSCTGNTKGNGTAFTPPYSLDMVNASEVKAIVTDPTCGAGQIDRTKCECSQTRYNLSSINDTYVNIYPSVVENNLHIIFKEANEYTVEIYSLTGKIISSYKAKNESIDINMSAYSSGIYLCKIISKDKVITKKIYKK